MCWHRLGKHWPDFLGVDFRSTLKLEPLICLLVCGLALKPMRSVLAQTDHGRPSAILTDTFKHFVVLSQLFLLFLCEVLFIARLSFKRKRVEGILRMFFMENIILAIFPIWEGLCICALSNYGFFLSVGSFGTPLLWLHFKVFICIVACSSSFHFMRVDNFRFFFQIECFSFLENNSVTKLIFEILMVSGLQGLWVWISDKFIRAPCLATSLISCQSSRLKIGTIFLHNALTSFVLSVTIKK